LKLPKRGIGSHRIGIPRKFCDFCNITKDAIAVGTDGLAHLFADQAPDDEFISLAIQHYVLMIPTLSVLASSAGDSNGPFLAPFFFVQPRVKQPFRD